MQVLPLLKTQCVRDLAWSCFSDNLIDNFCQNLNKANVTSFRLVLTKKRKEWLEQLDDDPIILQRHLMKLKSPRLGIYFEALWQFFLQEDDDYELVAHNLQVHRNKKTLGEFDIIFKSEDNSNYYHLELAIKYYLNCSTTQISKSSVFSADYHYWLGPNAIDRLDIKTAHLLNHQTQLSKSAEGKELLQENNIPHIRQLVALKGTLFYPYGHDRLLKNVVEKYETGKNLSDTHSRSHWIKNSDFGFISNQWSCWYQLKKGFWISPAYGQVDQLGSDIINRASINHYLKTYFHTNQQPLMLCAMIEQEDYFLEEKRFFITPDNWPIKN
jgi:hypothetical protein